MAAPANLLKGFARTAATTKPNPAKRLTISDPDSRGLFVRITPRGKRTWTIVARNPDGKQVWREIGDIDQVTLDAARLKAKDGVARIKQGLDPFPTEQPKKRPDTFRKVSEDFLRFHVKVDVTLGSDGKVVREGDGRRKRKIKPLDGAKTLRSAGEIVRQFDEIFWPRWGDRDFQSLRKRDIAELLDEVELDGRAGMGDHLLATLSKLCAWYATREDDYLSPVVRGMRRTKPAEQERERVLSSDEILTVWQACSGTFGAVIKTCLLTAQRRGKVAAMRWDDIKDGVTVDGLPSTQDGVWIIPAEPREKVNAGALKLPQAALDIIKAQPRIEGNPFVFAGRRASYFNGYSKAKLALDGAILDAMKQAAAEAGDDPEKVEKIPEWVIHDLRRTARTIMERAGVRPDVAERALGHAIQGIKRTYNRYDYFKEKADALEAVASYVDRIINPPADNVVDIKGAA